MDDEARITLFNECCAWADAMGMTEIADGYDRAAAGVARRRFRLDRSEGAEVRHLNAIVERLFNGRVRDEDVAWLLLYIADLEDRVRRTVPERERWLYENPEALEKVRVGLAQAARGDIHHLAPQGAPRLTPAQCRARYEVFMDAARSTWPHQRRMAAWYLAGARDWMRRYIEAVREPGAVEDLLEWRRETDAARAERLENPSFDPSKSAERGREALRRLGLAD